MLLCFLKQIQFTLKMWVVAFISGVSTGNKVYWSREAVGFNTLVYEDSQRPFIQPKVCQTQISSPFFSIKKNYYSPCSIFVISTRIIPLRNYFYPSTIFLLQDDQKWDAHAVETTAYGLLCFVERESLGIIQENIVRFLAVMRELDGGLISTLVSFSDKYVLLI